MSRPVAYRRGQPILFLLLLLGSWVAVRAALWERPFSDMTAPPSLAAATRPTFAHAHRVDAGRWQDGSRVRRSQPWHLRTSGPAGGRPPRHVPRTVTLLAGLDTFWLPDAQTAATSSTRASRRRPRQTAGLWSAAPGDGARWSADGWLLMRSGTSNAAQAAGAAAYGASQAGAVVRYRLRPGSARDPYAYLRASLALGAPSRDRELALGAGLRPVEHLPLRLLVEARLQDTQALPPRLRPAAMVVTELPWQALPLGFRGEVYGQAGYVAGQDATPFFDAQALADRPMPGLLPASFDLRTGLGAWAGGQKGAARFDFGPRASVALDFGAGPPVRAALDWRFRMAGNALPGSGPALTVTTGF